MTALPSERTRETATGDLSMAEKREMLPAQPSATGIGVAGLHSGRVYQAQQAARLSLVRLTRATAVAITVFIAAISFVLSFASLADLAARTVWPGRLAWLWPIIVDGTIVLATMALVAFSAYPEQRGPRRYFWALLAAGATVSVAGNALHAMLPTEMAGQPLGSWGAGALACVPPLALVLVTHALSILWRFTPYEQREVAMQQHQDEALVLAAERLQRWDAVAAAIHERGQLQSHPTATIADALRMLHDTHPAPPLRQIGQHLGLRHDAVARIRDAAKAVLDERTDAHPVRDVVRKRLVVD